MPLKRQHLVRAVFRPLTALNRTSCYSLSQTNCQRSVRHRPDASGVMAHRFRRPSAKISLSRFRSMSVF